MSQCVRDVALWAMGGLMVACGSSTSPVQPIPDPLPSVVQTTAVLVGAGDIADCANDGGRHAEDTAKLLDKIDGTVFVAGDLALPDGSASQFATCYEPRWGRHKSRTRPAPGNHEYEAPGAVPYFNYFGNLAGPFGVGFYSYTLGSWHVVTLNNYAPARIGSEQWTWLREDLVANPARCTVAYFHEPRFTSGPSGGGVMADLWRVMYEAGVDVIINGHDHGYERFAPQDPDGRTNSALGIRQFVVGSGGAPLYQFVTIRANSEKRLSSYGVLKLTLRSDTYDWSFIEAVTEAVLDAGSDRCQRSGGFAARSSMINVSVWQPSAREPDGASPGACWPCGRETHRRSHRRPSRRPRYGRCGFRFRRIVAPASRAICA